MYLNSVVRAETKEAIVGFVTDETVEPYMDGKYNKCFRAGGKLEWFNPPFDIYDAIQDSGTEDDAAKRAREEYKVIKNMLPEV